MIATVEIVGARNAGQWCKMVKIVSRGEMSMEMKQSRLRNAVVDRWKEVCQMGGTFWRVPGVKGQCGKIVEVCRSRPNPKHPPGR